MMICSQTSSKTFVEVTNRPTFTPPDFVAIKIPLEISLKVGCDKRGWQILIIFSTEQFSKETRWRASRRKSKAFHKMHEISIISLRKLLDWNNRLWILKIAFQCSLERLLRDWFLRLKPCLCADNEISWIIENYRRKSVLIDSRVGAISKGTMLVAVAASCIYQIHTNLH